LVTWVSDVERTDVVDRYGRRHPSTAVRHYTVTRVSDGALLARARMLWGVVDVKTEQPMRIPDTFLADLAPDIAGGLP